MKKRMWTAMVGAAVLVLAAGLFFTGCAKKETGPVTLTVWARDLTDGTPDHAYVTALVPNFQVKYPTIKLDYVALGEGLNDKLKVAMSAKSGLPDVFQSWGGSLMGNFVDGGMLLDLTKELKSVPGSAAAQAAMTWKEKIYGVAPFFAICGIFVNEGIFQNLGLKPAVTTVDELAKNADALLAKHIQPFAAGGKDKWPVLHLYMYLVDRFGGPNAFPDAAARKTHFTGEPFIKAARFYQDWVKKGYFGTKPLGEAYGDAQQLMANGKAAMHVTGSWMCAQYGSADFTKEKLGFYGFPEMTGGVGPATDVMGMTDIGFAATKQAVDKKDAIVKFMTYSMTADAGAAEPGRVASMPGVAAKNPLTTQASAVFAKAKVVQFWWDQNLPAAATTPINDVVQVFFLPNGDVEKALKDFDKLMDEAVGPVK
jgi:raffinose/stachyose/melibiose transport system substrate-binding protein